MADEPPSPEQLKGAILVEQIDLLDAALSKIVHCLQQLSDEQLWWRPGPDQNSVGNLILHICGNLDQWVVCGVGGADDQRDREAEFAAVDGPLHDELSSILSATRGAVRSAIREVSLSQLVSVRQIQGFDVTGLGAIVHSVTHFVGHTHQIIQLTRWQLGQRYEFDWSPDRGTESLPI